MRKETPTPFLFVLHPTIYIFAKAKDKSSFYSSIQFHLTMVRHLLLTFLVLCILFALINGKSECSCSCCKGNRCIKQYLGSIRMPTCSATSCKNACKLRHPSKCTGSPGSITATCTKTKAPHRSPTNKIKQKLRPSPKKYIKTPYI